MRIAYLVFNLDGTGGTSRSAITQANALAEDHDVRLVSITRSADQPHYQIDERVAVGYLVDVRLDGAPAVAGALDEPLTGKAAALLHARESALVPARWDGQFTALCDVAMEAVLPTLDADVAVTVTPGLLVAAIELLPGSVVVVHQEHRSSSDRTSGVEPLLAYAPRADVVSLLTPAIEEWLRDRLGDLAPPTVVMPNPLPLGFAPRSRLDRPLIASAGRLVPEKQFHKLVAAFGQVADRIPDWRLRIYGEGPVRLELLRQIRRWNLWDRVELPGTVADMTHEWAKVSICALTSRAEGFPLVLQEAMAAGVPAASFDCASGPREIVHHEVDGLLVAPESVTGMAAALLRLATDDDLRRRLGAAALGTARRYDARALAERWVGIFADARVRRCGRGRLEARARSPRPTPRRDPAAAAKLAGLTPARVRREVLSIAVEAARSVTDHWLVMPPHDSPAAVLVLPMHARADFLGALAEADPPAHLCLREPAGHGWHERGGPVVERAVELARGMTPVVCLEP